MTCLVLDGSASDFKPTIHAVVAYVHMKMAAKIYAHMKKIFFFGKISKIKHVRWFRRVLHGSAANYITPKNKHFLTKSSFL